MKNRANINFKLEKDNKDLFKQSDYIIYKDLKLSSENINNVLEKFQDINATNKLISSIAIDKYELLEKKNIEINKLNSLITDCISANNEIKDVIRYENYVRNELDSEQRNISSYCNDLKIKFKNVPNTIEEYEKNINVLNQDNNGLIKLYEDKVCELDNECNSLINSYNTKLTICAKQKADIVKKTNKIEEIQRDIENQRNYYCEKDMLHKIKYEELMNKYTLLEKKVGEEKLKDDIRENEFIKASKTIENNKFERDEIEVKIKKVLKENNNLKENIKNMNFKINEMSSRIGNNRFMEKK